MMKTDVTVIGAGAAGLTAAVSAASRGLKVILIEKSERPGRKILASGNGRCNMMNGRSPVYYGDPDFAASVMNKCPAGRIKDFFLQYGLMTTEDEEGRVYPLTLQAASVLAVLKNAIHISGVSLIAGFDASEIKKDKNQYLIRNEKGEEIVSGKVVITCGGAAQPKLGGSSDGYRLLERFGHRIIPVFPSLVSLTTDKKSISGLSGIRIHGEISLFEGSCLLHQEKGEILFTDYGISGICVMQCARFTENKNTHLEINFLENLDDNPEEMMNEFRRRQIMLSDLSPVSLFDGILPERISYAVMKQAGIPMRGETAGSLTDSDLKRITETAHKYRIYITGTRGMDYAQVTAGGADCSEFNPETMESRLMPGLHAAGEVLNVDGDCGGFNLMFAFASGIIAGESV
ncbi:MAG: aminoacetone oxidase family FAD-binding enzyme [Clostridia bacterium]|nr:aminoacetone oxidase family FAD-binding enzyme [Clostridia bacterium]